MPFACSTRALVVVLSLLAIACSSDNAVPVAAPTVTVPDRVTAGDTFNVTYRFAVPAGAPRLSDDYTVFVHVMDESATRLWTGDHQPPTPTSQWRENSVIEYTRPMRVPRSAGDGRVTLELGLYLPETGERQPLSGDRTGRRSYRVATLDVVPEPAERQDVFFTDGWYDVEAPEEAQGLEWRWSAREAMVWLRNPQRDSIVVIELDQPVALGGSPQQVEILVDGHAIDTFALAPSQHLVRRTMVPAATLGRDEFARLTLRLDRTFVPARLTGATSADQRELGVRVFSIAIENEPNGAAGNPPP